MDAVAFCARGVRGGPESSVIWSWDQLGSTISRAFASVAGKVAGAGLWAVSVIPVVILAVATAIASEPPTGTVKGTINEVIGLLTDEDLKQPSQSARRRKLIEEAVGKRFDYEEMAKRSLAAQWNKLSEPEKQEFVELFQALLSNSYANKIEGYSGEQVHYLKERVDGAYAEVRTKIVSTKSEFPLDYRLVNQSGDWRVYDVVIDGVSLVKNYRSQFERIIRSSTYNELVEKLMKKSADIKEHY
jgi:phospholipid transport system substrate-binding protein